MIRILILLMQEKYDNVEKNCLYNIKKGHHIGYYYNSLMISKTFQQEYVAADQYLEEMLNVAKVSKSTKNHYIKFLLSTLIKNKEYERIHHRSIQLLEDEQDDYICKVLLKALCQVNYEMGNYDNVKNYCKRLEVYKDNEIIKFHDWYLQAII